MTEDRVHRTEVDKGWAWMVMFSSFGCQIITGGLLQTSGLVRYALLNDVSKENYYYISWIGSIYTGLISMAGPLSSLMVYKLGCRTTVLFGATLETLGFVCSYFVQNVKLLFLTYSLFGGLGSGIAYSAVMIVLGYNFDKYLSIASGLSVSGQGLGLLTISILLNFCLEYYDLKGSFLIMAGLTLQKWVFGSLLRPSTIEMAQTKRFWLKETASPYPDGNIEFEVRKETPTVMLKNALSLLSLSSHQSSRHDCDIVHTSLQRISKEHDSTLSLRTNKESKKSHEFHNAKDEIHYSITNVDVIDETPHLSIFQNVKFINFLFCIMCSSTAEGMIYLMLPSYLISNGASKSHASRILSVIGICSTLTRPLMGFLANSNMVDIFLLYLAPFAILGVLTAFLPFYVHLLVGQILFGIIFGLYNCSVYALLNRITLRIAGMDNMATAFGLEMLVWGITGILGTPLADCIVEWTDSFSSAFVFAGFMYLVCTVAAFFLPLNLSWKVIPNNEPVHI